MRASQFLVPLMFSSQQRQSRIADIRELPAIIKSAVAGLNDEQLDTRYRDGGWTIRQVVHHVADSHMNAYLRFRWLVTEDHPTIKTYDQDIWAGLSDSRLALDSSLRIIDGLHERWAAFLDALPEAAWSRKGMHPELGEVSLDDLLEIYSGHGAHHAGQITDLRARKGW
ncbi:MAG TPA: putative metal-dependent hydrolase [Gemmatimonadaceae bacterium]|nr:putative metal-dependent hydrolase [Gemmatimonadaceae bacterium]